MERKNLIISVAILAALVIVLIVAASSMPEEAAEIPPNTLALSAEQRVGVGDTVRVDITANQIADVQGVQIGITYPQELLALDRVEEGDFLSRDGETIHFAQLQRNEEGQIHDIVIVRTAQPAVSGDGIVASVYFTAEAQGEAEIGFGEVLVGDSEAEKIAVNTQGTTITIR